MNYKGSVPKGSGPFLLRGKHRQRPLSIPKSPKIPKNVPGNIRFPLFYFGLLNHSRISPANPGDTSDMWFLISKLCF